MYLAIVSHRRIASCQGGILKPAPASFALSRAQYRGRAARMATPAIVIVLNFGVIPSWRAASCATSCHVAWPEFTQ